jgi:cobalt-zinc-cadmium efflux system protein
MKEKEHINNEITDSTENIKIAFYLNLMFSILEAIGGFLTNSISIMSDAIHDLGDSISVGLSYVFERKSRKLPNDKYTYGYLRYSLLGALITSFVLLFGSVVSVIIINGYAAYKTSKGAKTNERVISLHMLEDVLGWIVVLVGSICIKIFDLYIIDPILSILISIYILIHVYKYLKDVFDIFMEKVPSDIKIDEIKKKLISNNSIIGDIHHIHLWTMDGVNNYMTAHIVLNTTKSEKDIIKLKNEIKRELREQKIFHVTLEIEYKKESCNDENCDKAV